MDVPNHIIDRAARLVAVFPHAISEADLMHWLQTSPRTYLDRVEEALYPYYLQGLNDLLDDYSRTPGASANTVLTVKADLAKNKNLRPGHQIDAIRRMYASVKLDLRRLWDESREGEKQAGFTGINGSVDREKREAVRRRNLANRANENRARQARAGK